MRRTIRVWGSIFTTFIIFFLFNAQALSVGTVAGTNLVVGRAEVHHDGRTEYSNSLSIVVAQDYGLNLATPEVIAALVPGESYYYPHTLTNIGNGSDSYKFELSNTTDKWSSTLIKDENFNGIHEDTENTPVATEVILAEDANYYFFVDLTAPADLRELAAGSTTLRVSGTVDDGAAYLGANGYYYGGPDEAGSTLHAQVVYVDTTAPTISDLHLNGRKRFSEDIISPVVRVQATILDDETENVERIEVYFDDLLQFSCSRDNWKGAYDQESGKFERTLAPLKTGEHSFKIIAYDCSGNQAQETISPLHVYDPNDKRVIGSPVNHPNPFQPLKGEKTHIAYVLTTDMDITLYIHDIRGSVVWKRTYPAFEEGGKAGYNEILWSGATDFGPVLGNGIYIFKMVNDKKIIGRGKITILDYK